MKRVFGAVAWAPFVERLEWDENGRAHLVKREAASGQEVARKPVFVIP